MVESWSAIKPSTYNIPVPKYKYSTTYNAIHNKAMMIMLTWYLNNNKKIYIPFLNYNCNLIMLTQYISKLILITPLSVINHLSYCDHFYTCSHDMIIIKISHLIKCNAHIINVSLIYVSACYCYKHLTWWESSLLRSR